MVCPFDELILCCLLIILTSLSQNLVPYTRHSSSDLHSNISVISPDPIRGSSGGTSEMESRSVDIFCFGKTRFRENFIGMIKRKATQYKLL